MKFELDKRVEGLIFDLDGTLADTMPFHLKAWQYATEIFNLDFSSEFLKRHTGTPAWRIAETLFKENGVDNRETLDRFLKTKTEWFYKNQHLVKEIKPVADIVRQYYKSLPMAIGTGGHDEAVKRTLQIIGMREYFDAVVTANNVTNHKPDPETFLKCAELIKIDPDKIVVFEDGDLGIEAALRAGMTPVDVRSWYKYVW